MAQGLTPIWEQCRNFCRIRNEYVRESMAEFLGTLLLVLFVVGGNIQQLLYGNSASSIAPVLAGTFGLMIAITITGGASGGITQKFYKILVNPAVTLALAIAGKCSWFKFPLFFFVQIFGAYIGAGLAYGVYEVQLDLFEGKTNGSVKVPASIFSPVPLNGNTIGTGIMDQVLGTSILVMMIFACIDKRNMQVPKGLIGPLVGLTVGTISLSFEYNAGASLNPARDLGPRLMALTVGFTREQVMQNINFKGNTQELWLVGIFGPIIGGIVGSLLYIMFIGAHLDETPDEIEGLGRQLSVHQGQSQGPQTQSETWRDHSLYIPKAMSPHDPNSSRFDSPPPVVQAYNNRAYARDDMSLKQRQY